MVGMDRLAQEHGSSITVVALQLKCKREGADGYVQCALWKKSYIIEEGCLRADQVGRLVVVHSTDEWVVAGKAVLGTMIGCVLCWGRIFASLLWILSAVGASSGIPSESFVPCSSTSAFLGISSPDP